jgi:hypothetical protein
MPNYPPSRVPTEQAEGTDSPQPTTRDALHRRVLELWPRVDRRVLARCGADSHRIAAHVSKRSSQPVEAIRALIDDEPQAPRDEDDGHLWFG